MKYPAWLKEFNKDSGVYGILNIPDNIHYVGSTVNVRSRLSYHWANLVNNNFRNTKLREDFKRLGPDNFYLFVFEYCDISELEQKEDYYIAAVEESYNVRGAHVGKHRRSNSRIKPTTMLLSEDEKEKMDKISQQELGVKNRNGLLRKWINTYTLD